MHIYGDSSRDAAPPPLIPGGCQVWWARPADAHPGLRTLLDPDERERWTALRQPADRDRFLVGCGLVRLVLAGHLGQPPGRIGISRSCRDCGKPHGKPRLTPPAPRPLEFSVSHSGDRIVVALAEGTPLGVDVEQVREGFDVDELAPEALTAEEAETLRALRGQERTLGFLAYWTRKESVVKATGRGLAIPLKAFGVSGPHEPPRLVWAQDPVLAGQVWMHDLDPGPGHVASLAVLGRCTAVAACDGSALLARYPYRLGPLYEDGG
ncbi:MAG TPA: 4'-phosphopantetheinyl transferase superfamily protein [Actinomycetota bacterium]|jgi:4'-phosphopantetheinyl transferase